jgi:hypothetical protein
MAEARARVRMYFGLPCGQVITGMVRHATGDTLAHRAACPTCAECKDYNDIVVNKNGRIDRPRGESFRRENGQMGTITRITFVDGLIPSRAATDRIMFEALTRHEADGGYWTI